MHELHNLERSLINFVVISKRLSSWALNRDIITSLRHPRKLFVMPHSIYTNNGSVAKESGVVLWWSPHLANIVSKLMCCRRKWTTLQFRTDAHSSNVLNVLRFYIVINCHCNFAISIFNHTRCSHQHNKE